MKVGDESWKAECLRRQGFPNAPRTMAPPVQPITAPAAMTGAAFMAASAPRRSVERARAAVRETRAPAAPITSAGMSAEDFLAAVAPRRLLQRARSEVRHEARMRKAQRQMIRRRVARATGKR